MPKKTTASPARTLSVAAATAAAAAAAAPSPASASAPAAAAADAAAAPPALGYLVRHSAVLLLIAMNVSASVALVGVNKYLVLAHGFRFVLLLSGLHFAVGYALLHGISAPGCGSARSFERKVPPLWQSLPAAVAGMASIVLMNYSLRTNTVGSYQMLKVAVLPATIALAAVQGTRITGVDLGTAALVSAGTAIATVTDVDLTLGGGAIGLAAVLATAQYQVAQGRIQKESELTSTQAMHAISLPQAVLTLGASLVLETAWERFAGSGGAGGSGSSAKEIAALRGVGAFRTTGGSGGAWEATSGSGEVQRISPDIWNHPYSLGEVGLILLTCVCAAALNYSGIALIGKINAIAFQFVNQLKTVLVVSVGFIVFAEAADTTRLLSVLAGLACVVSGIVWYTYNKQQPKTQGTK